MDPLVLIEQHAQELHKLGARRVGVFGSFARNQATPDSDVDVYVEFFEGMKTYDNFFEIYELLQGLFGRPIDHSPSANCERSSLVRQPVIPR